MIARKTRQEFRIGGNKTQRLDGQRFGVLAFPDVVGHFDAAFRVRRSSTYPNSGAQGRSGESSRRETLAFDPVGLRFVNVLGVMSMLGFWRLSAPCVCSDAQRTRQKISSASYLSKPIRFRSMQEGCGDAGSIGSGGWNGKSMPKKVMIVEDNELNMKLFRDLIEASGYETVRTRNGLEAAGSGAAAPA